MKTSIVSFNVNGIRSAISKGLVDWIAKNSFDVICFQELKGNHDQFDVQQFHDLGYHCFWHPAEKKGYSGVGVISKIEPTQVTHGMGFEKYDREGRVLHLDYGNWSLLNCYFPSGTTGEERQAFKMVFLDDFYDWFGGFRKKHKRVVVTGDYNIAHQEIDIHDPKGNKNSSGFLPEERAWMTKWFHAGMTDAYRHLHPDQVEYSWWSFRANARKNNKGWRIDYQSVTDNLKDQILQARQLMEVNFSDHCPVWVEYKL